MDKKTKDESVKGKFFLANFHDGRLLVTKENQRALRVDFSVQMTDAKDEEDEADEGDEQTEEAEAKEKVN